MADRVVRLTFPAKAEYLLLARLALSGLARELPLEEELLADLKLAVTEACGNAVRHAYPDGGGDVSLVVHHRRQPPAADRRGLRRRDPGAGLAGRRGR